MYCSLSGEIATNPVVSIKSGHVFEQSLLEKYLNENDGKCPLTGKELCDTDLLKIVIGSGDENNQDTNENNVSATPRPVTGNSVPALLQTFQNEWDSTMLECHSLKKHLDTTRQELAQLYYQHDAAVRVIAKLLAEKGEKVNSTIEQEDTDSTMQVEETVGLPLSVQEIIKNKAMELSKTRKSNKSTCLRNDDTWDNITTTSSHTPHKSDKPGITCLDLHPEVPLSISGGIDTVAKVFNRETKKVVATLSQHTKSIQAVAFHPTTSDGSVVITASADKTVKLWRSGKTIKSVMKFTLGHTFDGHENVVSDVAVHATGDFIGTSSHDSTWALFDIRVGTMLSRSKDETTSDALNCFAFHPDGGICATGSLRTGIKMWDVNSMTSLATFEGHGKASISDLSFSENGYHMASGGVDGYVYL